MSPASSFFGKHGTTLVDSAVASSLLLRSVTYPDSVDAGDVVLYSYNRQHQQSGMTDQRGCDHEYRIRDASNWVETIPPTSRWR